MVRDFKCHCIGRIVNAVSNVQEGLTKLFEYERSIFLFESRSSRFVPMFAE